MTDRADMKPPCFNFRIGDVDKMAKEFGGNTKTGGSKIFEDILNEMKAFSKKADSVQETVNNIMSSGTKSTSKKSTKKSTSTNKTENGVTVKNKVQTDLETKQHVQTTFNFTSNTDDIKKTTTEINNLTKATESATEATKKLLTEKEKLAQVDRILKSRNPINAELAHLKHSKLDKSDIEYISNTVLQKLSETAHKPASVKSDNAVYKALSDVAIKLSKLRSSGSVDNNAIIKALTKINASSGSKVDKGVYNLATNALTLDKNDINKNPNNFKRLTTASFKKLSGDEAEKLKALKAYLTEVDNILNSLANTVKDSSASKIDIKTLNVNEVKELKDYIVSLKEKTDEELNTVLTTLKKDDVKYKAVVELLKIRSKSTDYTKFERRGKDVTVEDIKTTFNLKELVIKNAFKTAEEQQKRLNQLYDDYLNIARTTNSPLSAIGSGKLGINFVKKIVSENGGKQSGVSVQNKTKLSGETPSYTASFHEFGHQLIYRIAEELYQKDIKSKKISIDDAVNNLFDPNEIAKLKNNKSIDSKKVNIVEQIAKIVNTALDSGSGKLNQKFFRDCLQDL